MRVSRPQASAATQTVQVDRIRANSLHRPRFLPPNEGPAARSGCRKCLPGATLASLVGPMAQGQVQGRPPPQPRHLGGAGESANQLAPRARPHGPPQPSPLYSSLSPGTGIEPISPSTRRLGWIPPSPWKEFRVPAAAGAPFPPNLPHSGFKRTSHVSLRAARAPWRTRKADITEWRGRTRPILSVKGPWEEGGGCSPESEVH